jgi:isopentenyl-diphosphate Delta-isomerase
MSDDHVILVDESDTEIGTMEKMTAHRLGVLHRAFSAFIFNSKGEMLLQQRALSKYHSGGLWTNTCCSHPRLGESVENAAERRLMEEMGMTSTFSSQFSFLYRAHLDSDLIEHELDHVLVGYSDDIPNPNPSEVASWRYVSLNAIREEIDANQHDFTEWFKICFDRVDSLQTSIFDR